MMLSNAAKMSLNKSPSLFLSKNTYETNFLPEVLSPRIPLTYYPEQPILDQQPFSTGHLGRLGQGREVWPQDSWKR